MTELWRVIPGFEDYEASWLGHIRRSTPAPGTRVGKILRPGYQRGGYQHVVLRRNGRSHVVKVHQAVARTYLGPCPTGQEVNHLDGDKTNNSAANLQYATRSANNYHAYRTGIRKDSGEGSPHAVLTAASVEAIRSLKGTMSQREIGELYGVSMSNIGMIHRNQTWQHEVLAEKP